MLNWTLVEVRHIRRSQDAIHRGRRGRDALLTSRGSEAKIEAAHKAEENTIRFMGTVSPDAQFRISSSNTFTAYNFTRVRSQFMAK